MDVLWLLLPLLLIACVYAFLYNLLISRKNQVNNALGSVDVNLQKRHDLIPNLVAIAKQYMTHERELLEQVTNLRAMAMAAANHKGKFQLEGELSQALMGLLVTVENYPDLKANRQMLQLQAALNEVEEQLSACRRFYNTAVTDYNNAVEMFPSNLVARHLHLVCKPFFTTSDEERANPNVGKLLERE
jgi:LemA protein